MRNKILLLFLLLPLMAMAASRVTIRVQNKPMPEIFDLIMAQTGMNFIYTPDVIPTRHVSLNITDATIEKALDTLFQGQNISYKIRGRNISLRHKANRNIKKSPITISGFVRDAESGEALIGAIVGDSLTGIMTSTNSNGFYSLSLPREQAFIKASYLGFEPYSSPFHAKQGQKLDIRLRQSLQLHDIVVIGDKNLLSAMESPQLGYTSLSNQMIINTPTVFGESDVIKTLQFQPGITSGVEGMAGMQVHGGNDDQNLYMLDNIPLYQVNHFGGLFSAFNTESLKNVDFYKSAFPAKYDGRLSSIMDVHTKDGNLNEYHGSWRLGLTSGSVNIEGPILKNRTSFSVALRRSWFELLTIPGIAIYNATRQDKESNFIGRYAFMDFNAKINHHFSNRSRMHLMFYYGNDYLKGGNEEKYTDSGSGEVTERDVSTLNWGNIAASLNWNYVYTPNLFGEISASFTRYSSLLKRDYSNLYPAAENKPLDIVANYQTRNRIDDISLRLDYEFMPGHRHKIPFGAGYTFHSFNPEYSNNRTRLGYSTVSSLEKKDRSSAHEAYLYVSDDWKINDKWHIDYGLHFTTFTIDNHTSTSLNPRASVLYRPSETLSFKAAYARLSQYVHQLTETSISLPTDQWIPVPTGMKPQRSDKVSIGAYYNLHNNYLFSIEGYYKWMNHLVEYRDDYRLFGQKAPWEDKLTSGKGTSKGIDIMARKMTGAVTGYASYSLMWADRTFPEKNGGRTYPARYDNRHKFNIMANWRINEKWEINAAWTIMSGNMITLPKKNYEVIGDLEHTLGYYDPSVNYVSDINNYRLPAYHRLDIGVNLHIKPKHGREGIWNFSLYNAYCNMNVMGIRKNLKLDGQGNVVPVFQKMRMIPIIPSVSYTLKF